MLTPEEIQLLNNKNQQINSGKVYSSGMSASELFNKVSQEGGSNTNYNRNWLQKTGDLVLNVGSALTENEQNLGKDIGRGLLGGDKYFKDIQDRYTKNVNALTELATKQTDPGLKQKYLDMAKNNFDEAQKIGVDFKGRTWEQITGDVLGTALDVGLTVGGLGIAKGTVSEIKGLSTLEKGMKGIEVGGKTGALAGAGYGVASGLQENKNIGGVAENALKGGVTGGITGGVIGGVAAITPDIIQGIKNKIENVKDRIINAKEYASDKDLEKIQEIISPKPTTKELRLAEKQGRLIKGKEPGLLTSGKEDIIVPSDKVIKSSVTVKKYIPDASKLNEAELYTNIDNKIGEIATDLEPEMMRVPVTEESYKNLDSSWDVLKSIQLTDVDASLEGDVQKLQSRFQKTIDFLKSVDAPSMDDFWSARELYDRSIPDNVKKATSLSSDLLQTKKQIWLQNRALLNDIVNDMSKGLGETSKQAFKEMSNLYTAQDGLLSKVKYNTKPLPSKLEQFIKKHPYISTILGGGTLYGGAKKLGIPLP